MKTLLIASLVAASFAQTFAAPNPPGVRTIKNLPNFPIETLRLQTSRPIFRSLEISPVAVWLVARTSLGRVGHAGNAKIIHAEGNGTYDKMLLEMAGEYSIAGQNLIESRLANDTNDVHLLIYDIKDGKMAVCFAHTDDARYQGYKQFGTAWIGILKGGKWATISRDGHQKWGWQR